MTESPTGSLYVDSTKLRERFEALDILGRLHRGELAAVVAREWPAPPSSGQPDGTMSQRVLYMSGDQLIAVVHQYLLPDGSIGGSGRRLPDPKWLRDGDTVLKYRAPS
jgi:hypothetical protein